MGVLSRVHCGYSNPTSRSRFKVFFAGNLLLRLSVDGHTYAIERRRRLRPSSKLDVDHALLAEGEVFQKPRFAPVPWSFLGYARLFRAEGSALYSGHLPGPAPQPTRSASRAGHNPQLQVPRPDANQICLGSCIGSVCLSHTLWRPLKTGKAFGTASAFRPDWLSYSSDSCSASSSLCMRSMKSRIA